MANTNQWRIEGIRNSDVLKRYARECGYKYTIASPKEYLIEDTREAVILVGLTWLQMVKLVDDLRETLDVDCPPLQKGMFDDDAVDDDVTIKFPQIEAEIISIEDTGVALADGE